MEYSRLYLRVSIVGLSCVLAFCLGFEISHAMSALPSCEAICEDLCEPHLGCDDSQAEGGICYFWCMDGYNDAVAMGK